MHFKCLALDPHFWTFVRKKGFGKHCRKRRKCGNQHFLLFPQCFVHYQKRKIIILATFNLTSANGFSFVHSKILLFGRELEPALKVWLLLDLGITCKYTLYIRYVSVGVRLCYFRADHTVTLLTFFIFIPQHQKIRGKWFYLCPSVQNLTFPCYYKTI